MKKRQALIVSDTEAIIPLTKGMWTLVDSADVDELTKFNWGTSLSRRGIPYAIRHQNIDGHLRTIPMARSITRAAPGLEVDHINGQTLDNRRSNLRVCTRSQNNMNRHVVAGRSPYKGVGWHGQMHKWQAQIYLEGRSIYIGIFATEIEAAHAYDTKARELFGEYARLNFSEEAA